VKPPKRAKRSNESEIHEEPSKRKVKPVPATKSKPEVKVVEYGESSEDEDDPALEESYFKRRNEKSAVSKEKVSGDSSSEDEGSDTHPVHESMSKDGRTERPRARKAFVKPDETKEDRDRRTVFVGNLPVGVAKERVS
jgi:nucleolar protein 12